jgi:hypothetical protein
VFAIVRESLRRWRETGSQGSMSYSVFFYFAKSRAPSNPIGALKNPKGRLRQFSWGTHVKMGLAQIGAAAPTVLAENAAPVRSAEFSFARKAGNLGGTRYAFKAPASPVAEWFQQGSPQEDDLNCWSRRRFFPRSSLFGSDRRRRVSERLRCQELLRRAGSLPHLNRPTADLRNVYPKFEVPRQPAGCSVFSGMLISAQRCHKKIDSACLRRTVRLRTIGSLGMIACARCVGSFLPSFLVQRR